MISADHRLHALLEKYLSSEWDADLALEAVKQWIWYLIDQAENDGSGAATEVFEKLQSHLSKGNV